MGCIAVGGLDVDLGRKLSGTVFDNTKNQKLLKKRPTLKIFDAGHVEYDITKQFAAFVYLKSVNTHIFVQKWPYHLLLMASIL